MSNQNREQALARARGRTSTPMSAQAYHALSEDEKDDLVLVLTEDGEDPDEWGRNMKKLWPKRFEPKPLVWRDR